MRRDDENSGNAEKAPEIMSVGDLVGLLEEFPQDAELMVGCADGVIRPVIRTESVPSGGSWDEALLVVLHLPDSALMSIRDKRQMGREWHASKPK